MRVLHQIQIEPGGFFMSKKAVAVLMAVALITCFGGLPTPLWAQTTVKGTLTFNFSLDVNDGYGGPSGTPSCTGAATVSDAGTTISESATAEANGPYANATCTVSIRYTWHLASASTDKVVLSYTVSAPIPEGTAGASETRTSQVQNFATINVPANGTKTTKNITVVLN
jgi:hypothetical protein